MDTTGFSYPQWTDRMMGVSRDKQRVEELTARYAHLLFSASPILDFVSLDELAFIGNLLAGIPSSKEVFLSPYIFADLYLDDIPELQNLYNSLPFPLQCKVLDTARLYREADPPYAMLALDWESSSVQLLALSAHKGDLRALALAFLTDPLTASLVDERHEGAKAHLLSKSKALLLDGSEERGIGIYEVTCSDELFANLVFSPILDATFSLVMGEQKDRWGRATPVHIRESDGQEL